MRTQFQIWSRPTESARYKAATTLHDTLADAQQALGAPADTAWRSVDDRKLPYVDGRPWTTPTGGDAFISGFEVPETLEDRASLAVALAAEGTGIDGGHHKTWYLDQIARVLLGVEYDAFVAAACAGEEGPDTYEWDTGIAP